MPIQEFLTPPIQYLSGFRKHVGVGASCPMHTHPSYEIVFHPTGMGYTLLHDAKLPFAAGSLVCYPPDTVHTQYLHVTGEDVCVLFSSQIKLSQAFEAPFVLDAPNEILVRELCVLAETSMPTSPDEQLELDYRMTTVVYATWRSLINGFRPSGAHPYIEAAQQYIRTQYARIQFLGEIAAYIGISEDYLRHLFRAECGQSLRSWLTDVRIERAKELLRHFSLPLSTVAELCGFTNERYFSTVFARRVGCPPGAYRTRMMQPSISQISD